VAHLSTGLAMTNANIFVFAWIRRGNWYYVNPLTLRSAFVSVIAILDCQRNDVPGVDTRYAHGSLDDEVVSTK
jgi:hypothetical protein